ncbi:MAG: translation initiation factor IF-3 [Candidatus Cloacimonetes bacterium]|nr:translation initiation factor IF-3 [Candidatus Cloacimonadota bacterium]HQB98029.1 translation initiation factor IF-3 [Candidatus Cloacimonadota bacterium]
MPKERINHQINVDKVRLIGADGKQIGVVSISEALRRASEAEMDLVEISPTAEPPVCRILDFSKYYFQKEKKAKEAKKKQHEVEVKEIKFGPNTEEHDYNFKKNNAIKFLKQHNKVKFTVRFRGRQMAHKDLGYRVLEKLKEDLAYIADVDQEAVSDRNLLSIIVSPKKDIDRIVATDSKSTEQPATDSQPEVPQAPETE